MTNPARLTASRVLQLLRLVTAAHPDQITPFGAGRFKDGQPEDLVGHVLAAHGFTAKQFSGWEHMSARSLLNDAAATREAIRLLEAVDDAERDGNPWRLILPAVEQIAAGQQLV